MEDWTRQRLGEETALWVSPRHRFGTDAFVLADFARPRRGDLAADLGAGCGILGTLLLTGEYAPRQVLSLELQPEAVAQMERTAEDNPHLAGRLLPLLGDLRQPDALPHRGQVRLVVANPPYFAPRTGKTAPHPARLLARHEGPGCTLEEVVAAAAGLLGTGGCCCLCHRPEHLPRLLAALTRHHLEPKRLRMVQQRAGKAPWLVLVEGKKQAAPSLEIAPPLILEGEDGSLTPEALGIYRKAANRPGSSAAPGGTEAGGIQADGNLPPRR